MDRVRDEFEVWWASYGGMDAAPDEIEFALYIWKSSRSAVRVQLPIAWSVEQSEYKSALIDELDEEGVTYE